MFPPEFKVKLIGLGILNPAADRVSYLEISNGVFFQPQGCIHQESAFDFY